MGRARGPHAREGEESTLNEEATPRQMPPVAILIKKMRFSVETKISYLRCEIDVAGAVDEVEPCCMSVKLFLQSDQKSYRSSKDSHVKLYW